MTTSFRGDATASNPESRDSGSGPSGPSRNDLRSIQLLGKCRAEGMGGIDADDAEFAREEFQFFQRERKSLVVGMAVDIGIELCGKEIAVDHVALELRHVDAVGGKAAERLVEGCRQVAHPKNKSGHKRTGALLRPVRLACQHHETRGVVAFVLDIGGENVETVDFGGKL